jgi:hypothetical protein
MWKQQALAGVIFNMSHRDELTSGLVGYWTFDGQNMDLSSSTKEVLDSSGSNNNGDWLNHATTTTIGKIGQAIQFDGVDDLVSIADVPALSSSNVKSASLWIKRNSLTTTLPRVLNEQSDGSNWWSIMIPETSNGDGDAPNMTVDVGGTISLQ